MTDRNRSIPIGTSQHSVLTDGLRIIGVISVAALLAIAWSAIRTHYGAHEQSLRKGFVHPILTIPRARLGGTLRGVLAKTGDRVEAGQVLVRFEAKELEGRLQQLRQAAHAAEAAVKSGNAMAQIPNQVREYLYKMHPDTLSAEPRRACHVSHSNGMLLKPRIIRRAVSQHVGDGWHLFEGGDVSEGCLSGRSHVGSPTYSVRGSVFDVTRTPGCGGRGQGR